MQLNIIADFVWRVDVDNCNVYKIAVSTSLICYDVEKTSYHLTYHHTVSRLDLRGEYEDSYNNISLVHPKKVL
jgi:hypothetical protein